jgi:hypothetical protein
MNFQFKNLFSIYLGRKNYFVQQKKSSLIDEATFSYRILDAETVIFLMN